MKTKHKNFGQPFALALGMIDAITIASAKRQLAALGMTVNHNPDTDEYRVNYFKGNESTAYYTNELADALGTGLDTARSTNNALRAIR